MKFYKMKTWKVRTFFALAATICSLTAQNAYANCVREEYKVKRGDTLSTIIDKKLTEEHLKPGAAHGLTIYGPKGLIQRVLKLNIKKRLNPDLIFPGEKIMLPEEITPSFAPSLSCPKASNSKNNDSSTTDDQVSDAVSDPNPTIDVAPSSPTSTSHSEPEAMAAPATPSEEATPQVQSPAPASIAPSEPAPPPELASDLSLPPPAPESEGEPPPLPAAALDGVK